MWNRKVVELFPVETDVVTVAISTFRTVYAMGGEQINQSDIEYR